MIFVPSFMNFSSCSESRRRMASSKTLKYMKINFRIPFVLFHSLDDITIGMPNFLL